jgi:transposase
MEQQALIVGEPAEVVEQRRAARRAQRAAAQPSAPPRVREARRDQLEMQPVDLDALLPAGHRARGVWRLIERLDLSRFYAPIKARGSTAGRASTDPKVLLALWLYATADGVVHARELERLCHQHTVYRWLRGGVPVNYHTLSDFRTAHREALNELLTQVLGVMLLGMQVGLRRGALSQRQYDEYVAQARAAAGSIPAVIGSAMDWLDGNRRSMLRSACIIFYGSGALYGVALEGAVKVWETPQIISIGYETEEGLHGPNYGYNHSHCVIVLDDGGTDHDKSVALARYMRIEKNNGFLVGVGAQAPSDLKLLPQGGAFSCLEYASVVQVVAFRLALDQGRDLYAPHDNSVMNSYFRSHSS